MKSYLSVLTSLLLIFVSTNLSFAQWVQTNGPFGGLIRCLFVNDTVVLVGRQAGVFLSSNNGSSWTQSTDPQPHDATAFVTAQNNRSPAKLFATDCGGGIYLSTDNGISWTTINNGLTNHSVFSLAVSDTNLLAGTGSGVFLSTNNGVSWNSSSTGLPNDTITALAGSDSIFFAGTRSNGVYFSTNNGTTWVDDNEGLPLQDKYINFLVVLDTSVFVGTGGSGSYRSSVEGGNWTRISQDEPIRGVTAFAVKHTEKSDTILFAAPYRNGSFLLSIDNGLTWDTVAVDAQSGDILCLAAVGGNLLAGTRYGGVFKSTDNGATWRQSNTGLALHVNTLVVIDTELFAGTNDAGVFVSTNDGSNWALTTFMSYATGIAVTPANDSGRTNLFAANYDYGIYLSTNNGASWDTIDSRLTNRQIFSLTTKGNILFAGTIGWGIFRSSDNGRSWTNADSGITTDTVYALASNDSRVFAGTMAGLYCSSDSGASWIKTNYDSHEPIPGTDQSYKFSSAWALAASGTSVFVKNELNLQVSTDNGETWTIAQTQSLSKNENNNLPALRNHCVAGTSLNLTDIYALTASKNFLYAGTSRGVWEIPMSDVTAVKLTNHGIPISYNLEQNYPNPFNPSTTISFSIPSKSFVSLKVFDLLGREVATIVSEELSAGTYTRQWNAANMSSGIYFYRLQVSTFTETKKMILLR